MRKKKKKEKEKRSQPNSVVAVRPEVRPALASWPTTETPRRARPATAAAVSAPDPRGSTRLRGVSRSLGGRAATTTAGRSDWTVYKGFNDIDSLESAILFITSAIDVAIKGKPLTKADRCRYGWLPYQAIPETQACLQGSTGKGVYVLLQQMDVVSFNDAGTRPGFDEVRHTTLKGQPKKGAFDMEELRPRNKSVNIPEQSVEHVTRLPSDKTMIACRAAFCWEPREGTKDNNLNLNPLH